jgi:hypothetical protein
VVNVGVALVDESGRLLPPVVLLLLFAAGVFILMAMVLSWAGGQVPAHL